jgi:hypothetical protein
MSFKDIGGVVADSGPHVKVTVIDGVIHLEIDGRQDNWANVETTKREANMLRNSLQRAERLLA